MSHTRAVLMDIDGTLLDSAEAQTQSWLRVLRDFGYDVAYRQVRARIGMGQDRLLRELCSAPLPFVWREPGLAESPTGPARRASRPSRPHAA